MKTSYSQSELSDAFSNSNTPNGSFAGGAAGLLGPSGSPGNGGGGAPENISFGTLHMMEKLKATNDKDDMDWSTIDRDIREEVGQSKTGQEGVGDTTGGPPELQLNPDVKFYQYPSFPPEPPGQQTSRSQPDDPTLVKLFMGNMRFEMGRAVVAWVISKACGSEVDMNRVLIHYKSNNGTPTATGCASVFLNQDDAQTLLEFNQRIFCGAHGIFVALTSPSMKTLLRERKILDVGPDNRVKGPRHAVVVEISRATTPNSSFSSTGSNSMVASYRPPRMSPPPHAMGGSAAAPQQPSVSLATPTYHAYPGVSTAPPAPPINNPTEFFVGGICYEATPHFVAWMLSLSGTTVHTDNVTLFEDNKTGGKRGCAMVKVESSDFPAIRAYHHRLLCHSKGVYVAESTQGIPVFLKAQKAAGEVMRGPSHAVVIEKRRAQATPPPSYGLGGGTGAGDMPPPPPYVPGGVQNWSFPMPGGGGMMMPGYPGMPNQSTSPQGSPPAVPVLAPAPLSGNGNAAVLRTPPANGSLSPPQASTTIRLDGGGSANKLAASPTANAPGSRVPEPSWKVATSSSPSH